MQITLKGKQMEISPRMRGHIEQKVQRLSRLFGDDARVEITVCEAQTRSVQDHFSVHLECSNIPYSVRASASAASVATALDHTLDKVTAQFGRQKSRHTTAHRLPESPVKVLALSRSGGVSEMEESAAESTNLHAEENEEIWSQIMEIRKVRTGQLSSQEVIAQMALEGLSFYPFFNSETNSVNVMYRLESGEGYGLLVPETGQV
jgi:putative sigma-54 modulation protein